MALKNPWVECEIKYLLILEAKAYFFADIPYVFSTESLYLELTICTLVSFTNVQTKVLVNTCCTQSHNSLRSHLTLSNLEFGSRRWQLWEYPGRSRLNRAPVLCYLQVSSVFSYLKTELGYCHASCGLKKSLLKTYFTWHGGLKLFQGRGGGGTLCSFLKFAKRETFMRLMLWMGVLGMNTTCMNMGVLGMNSTCMNILYYIWEAFQGQLAEE